MYHLDLLRLYSSNESLKEKGCLEKLHKYAKWMQSASIPQNARLSIDDNVNIGKSPSMNNIIEKEWDKSVCNLPDFIPFEYKTSSYYTVSFNGRERLLHALMSAHENKWLVYPEKTKEDIIFQLKIKLSEYFQQHFTYSIYKNYKLNEKSLNKNTLYTLIRTDDMDTHPGIIHLISEYLNLNIVVINKEGYNLYCNWIPERCSVFLWDDGHNAGCILHKNCTEHLRPVLNKDDHPIFLHLNDLNSKRTQEINIASQPEIKNFYSKIKKMTMKEIEEVSQKRGIDIQSKKKNELIGEIMEQILCK
jgi:hypothetical protein|tara:strand:- start:10219 stop:11130 length:912 start_codon:yes stop_codon:yes gene_type:complete